MQRISRMIPPNTPVSRPVNEATARPNPISRARMAPTILKVIMPRASRLKKIHRSLAKYLAIITMTMAQTDVIKRSFGSPINKMGWRSKSRSLTTPPPKAVTFATTRTPNRSICFLPAEMAPVMASTIRPVTNKTVNRFSGFIGEVLFEKLKISRPPERRHPGNCGWIIFWGSPWDLSCFPVSAYHPAVPGKAGLFPEPADTHCPLF